jgi:hypothetical protein
MPSPPKSSNLLFFHRTHQIGVANNLWSHSLCLGFVKNKFEDFSLYTVYVLIGVPRCQDGQSGEIFIRTQICLGGVF